MGKQYVQQKTQHIAVSTIRPYSCHVDAFLGEETFLWRRQVQRR